MLIYVIYMLIYVNVYVIYYVCVHYMKRCATYVLINVNDHNLKKRMLTLMVNSFLYTTKYGVWVHVYVCVHVCSK